MTTIDKQQCTSLILKYFPEYKKIAEEHLHDYSEILLHIFCAETINYPLIALLQTNKETEQIKKYCSLIEQLWREGNDEVVNVIAVTILEQLSDDKIIWHRFGSYLSAAFKNYINQDVLTTNFMMLAVEPL